MHFTAPTLFTLVLIMAGAVISAPALYKGFVRRGKGIVYEQNFLIQRAPQLATLGNILIIILGFLATNGLVADPATPLFSFAQMLPVTVAKSIAWLGVIILTSGLIFMIGGWYSLGDCFSTDAEVQNGHTVRKTGLLKYVMHPAYSGIIQCLVGASIAANCHTALIFTILMVAPLWLKRAKYEEQLLLKILGQEYKEYAETLKWRRLVPPCIPIGV